MSWAAAIAELRREIISRVEWKIANLFGWTTTTNSSAMGDADQVGLEDGVDGQRPARRVEPWGHRGRPPSKVRSLTLRLGSSNVFFLGVATNTGYGPDDLEDGETALYCSKEDTEIRLKQAGGIDVDAASGQDVTVNGGSLKVARRTDPVRVGTLAGTNGGGAVTFTFTPLDADGVPGTPVVGATVTIAGVIQDGAARFKG